MQITIIGVGLIGGSLALALKRAGDTTRIIGSGSRLETLERAVELGVIDAAEPDLSVAVQSANVIVLAMPVSHTADVFRQINDAVPETAVLTDVGSTKQSIIEALNALNPVWKSRFVPGHPVAGTEKSGPDAAFESLFDGRRVILTPTVDTDVNSLALVQSLWTNAGAQVCQMTAEHHDQVLAATSHLPHVLAASLVNCLAGMQEHDEILRYAAGGFADFTRIASSHPAMWRDIVEANRSSLLETIDQYAKELADFRANIDVADWDAVEQRFEQARSERAIFLEKYQSSSTTSSSDGESL